MEIVIEKIKWGRWRGEEMNIKERMEKKIVLDKKDDMERNGGIRKDM